MARYFILNCRRVWVFIIIIFIAGVLQVMYIFFFIHFFNNYLPSGAGEPKAKLFAYIINNFEGLCKLSPLFYGSQIKPDIMLHVQSFQRVEYRTF